jgi:hypothetical protein
MRHRHPTSGVRWLAAGCLVLACLGSLAADVGTNQPPATTNRSAVATAPASSTPLEAPVLAVDDSLSGQVLRVNTKARFAVLSFPPGRMPDTGQQFSVWRTNGVVGEARVSGPRRDETIIADLVSGEWKAGDEVREKPKVRPPAAGEVPGGKK